MVLFFRNGFVVLSRNGPLEVNEKSKSTYERDDHGQIVWSDPMIDSECSH